MGTGCGRAQQCGKPCAFFGTPILPCSQIAFKWSYSGHRDVWLGEAQGRGSCDGGCTVILMGVRSASDQESQTGLVCPKIYLKNLPLTRKTGMFLTVSDDQLDFKVLEARLFEGIRSQEEKKQNRGTL